MANIRPPPLSASGVARLVRDYFPFGSVVENSIEELDSYDDRNYYFRGQYLGDIPAQPTTSTTLSSVRSDNEFVIKILNWRESEINSTVKMLTEVKKFLYLRGLNVPFPLTSLNGSEIVTLTKPLLFSYKEGECDADPKCRQFHVRVLTYLPGTLLSDVTLSPSVMFKLGEYIGSLSREMKLFSYPDASARKLLQWDLKHLLTLRPLADESISDPAKLQCLKTLFDDFEQNVVPLIPTLPHSICHNDLNDRNIIVIENQSGEVEVNGLIDFSDCVYTPTVFDLGIAMAYASMEAADPVKRVAPLLSGYLHHSSLLEKEMNLLYYIILGRLTQSCVNGEYTYHTDPSNKYILTHLKPAWSSIRKLQTIGKTQCDKVWYDAKSKTLQDYISNEN